MRTILGFECAVQFKHNEHRAHEGEGNPVYASKAFVSHTLESGTDTETVGRGESAPEPRFH